MFPDFQRAVFEYSRSKEQDAEHVAHPHPVVVVGAGPVGLATAIDLAQNGVRVVLLDDDDRLSTGSRAICFSKRTLEIFDRLGCGDPIADKGVGWKTGKVFLQDDFLYQFDLLPEQGHKRPAFVNIQQYYVEGFLIERAKQLQNLELRWKSKVVGAAQDETGVTLTVETPDGSYKIACQYLVAADGSRSAVRSFLGLESKGRIFKDRFLIADVKMKADFPPERWFWFDPPFHRNQSVLLHRQPDDVWRIDFQLGWDADPVAERDPERVKWRVLQFLGEGAEFSLEWASVYTFVCLRMEKFVQGRVIFAGDSAHGVSPFGARGANSGIQDAENIAWKLRLVLDGTAAPELLESYSYEREQAADENILNSTRSTDFITPKTEISRVFRDATLRLAKDHPFARRLVNSGRLSVPSTYDKSPLNTADSDTFSGEMVPGAPCADAIVNRDGADAWFMDAIGNDFTGIFFYDDSIPDEDRLAVSRQPGFVPAFVALAGATPKAGDISDSHGYLATRYDARPGTFYLVRPDQHVSARFRAFDAQRVATACRTAMCAA